MKPVYYLLAVITVLVKTIMADELPPASEITDYLANPANVAMEPGLLKKTDNAENFVKKLSVEWKKVLTGVEDHAPGAREQVLLALGAEFLKPSTYLDFLDDVCAKANQEGGGGVKNEFIVAILNASMVKNGFLAYHYQDETVAAVIGKLKLCAVQRMPGQWDEFFEAVESGEARNTVIEEAARYGVDLPESLDSEGVLEE